MAIPLKGKEQPQIEKKEEDIQEPEYENVPQEDDDSWDVFDQVVIDEQIKERSKLPYPAVRLHTTLYGAKGGYVNIDLAGQHLAPMLDEFSLACRYAVKYNLSVTNQQAQSANGGSVQAQASTPSQDGVKIIGTGIDVIHSITIDAKGKVSYMLGNWQYPVNEGRGAEVAFRVYAEDVGFTQEHLETPGVYVPADWGDKELFGTWQRIEKPDGKKYIDILKVGWD